MISFEEYQQQKTASPVPSYDEYIKSKSVEEVPTVEQYEKSLPKPELEKQSFIAKHPTLYGAFGAAQSLVPYLKYIDPREREKFVQLSKKEQTRDLLVQNLETIAMLGATPIFKGMVPLVARYLPKTYKALQFIKTPIKQMGELSRTPAKEVAGKAMAEGQKLTAHKIAVYKKVAGEHPPAKLIKQFWDDSMLAAKPKAMPTTRAGAAVIKAEDPILASDVGPIQRVQTALRKAAPKRKEQELLYTQERRARIGKAKAVGEKLTGEARFRAETKALGGEMQKVEFEAIKSGISQSDTNALFDMIYQKIPDFYQQRTAGRGLAKLFGEMGGAVPQESELIQLRKVFPQGFIKDLIKKQSLWKRMKELGYEVINIPRAIMASFDLSAPLRQGIFLAPSHPIRFGQSFAKMFKQFGSEKAYNALRETIPKAKWYNLLDEGGLQITDIGGSLTKREEAFMGAQLAEKIPVVGRVVRASNRAFTGFLNKFRVDVGNDLVEKASKAGLDPENNPALVKAITGLVNAGTGRGSLGSLERSAVALNTLFFSPRLMASRLTLLNPVYYVNPKTPAFVRKEALKSLFAFSGAIGTTLGLAKTAGLKVGTDPRSANFGKIIVGDTRLDIMGGFQQYLRIAGQLVSGKYISSTTGKEFTLGEGYKPLTRKEIIYRQLEGKMAPPVSFAKDLLEGTDIEGKPISVPKEIGRRFVPMVVQDIYDLAKEDPELLPLSTLGVFGVGLQTYKGIPSKQRGIGSIGGIEN